MVCDHEQYLKSIHLKVMSNYKHKACISKKSVSINLQITRQCLFVIPPQPQPQPTPHDSNSLSRFHDQYINLYIYKTNKEYGVILLIWIYFHINDIIRSWHWNHHKKFSIRSSRNLSKSSTFLRSTCWQTDLFLIPEHVPLLN